ncbi:MAG: hypothetical protein AAGB06_02655, partial [Verrucomicrobiota bacterium]
MTAIEFAESSSVFFERTLLDFERPLVFERSLPDDDDELRLRSLRERRFRDCESCPEVRPIGELARERIELRERWRR